MSTPEQSLKWFWIRRRWGYFFRNARCWVNRNKFYSYGNTINKQSCTAHFCFFIVKHKLAIYRYIWCIASTFSCITSFETCLC